MVTPLPFHWGFDLHLRELTLQVNLQVREIDFIIIFPKEPLADLLYALFKWDAFLVVFDVVDDISGFVTSHNEYSTSIFERVLLWLVYLQYLNRIPPALHLHRQI